MSAPRERRITVLLLDPDPLARGVVRDRLRDAGFVIVAEAAEGREGVDLARHYEPDLAVCEARLPDADGVAVIRSIHRHAPGTRIVVLTTECCETVAIQALRGGAVGYLPKHDSVAALPHVLAKVAEGEAAVPRALAMRVLDDLHRLPERGWRPLHSRLTTREWEIVEQLAGGASTGDIADTLFVSHATVYGHVKQILRKLGVHNREDAVAAAYRLRPEELQLEAIS